MKTDQQRFFKMLGNSILLASIQPSLWSCEMSNTTTPVMDSYYVVAGVWTVGSSMISYGQYGVPGLVTSIIANLVLIAWLYSVTRKRTREYDIHTPTFSVK